MELPPRPEREEQEIPQTFKDCALLVVYYEGIVQQWELWADTVEEIIKE